jgi:hypothetical protein
VKRILTQVGATSNAMRTRRAAATGAAEAATGRASATKAGQAPTVLIPTKPASSAPTASPGSAARRATRITTLADARRPAMPMSIAEVQEFECHLQFAIIYQASLSYLLIRMMLHFRASLFMCFWNLVVLFPRSLPMPLSFLMLSSAELSRIHVLLCAWHVFLYTFFGLFFHVCRASICYILSTTSSKEQSGDDFTVLRFEQYN